MRNVVAPPVQFIAVAARLENTGDTSKVAHPPPPPSTKTDRPSHTAPDGAKKLTDPLPVMSSEKIST